ncbi:MAG: 50S ribosomal protein L28 [Planctomycetia bacterium]|nr:50S ribosomal protein L28 [Planctomycetia bacterium]
MARVCNVCGKGPRVGNQVTIRGKAKYLGGVGTKVTGITRRTFKPNLQRLHVTENGTNKTVLVCTQCIRSGMVTKLVKAKPFRLPAQQESIKKTDSKKADVKKVDAKGKAPAAAKATEKKGVDKKPADKAKGGKPTK